MTFVVFQGPFDPSVRNLATCLKHDEHGCVSASLADDLCGRFCWNIKQCRTKRLAGFRQWWDRDGGDSGGGALVILSLLCTSFTVTHIMPGDPSVCEGSNFSGSVWRIGFSTGFSSQSGSLRSVSPTVHPSLTRYFLVGLVSSSQHTSPANNSLFACHLTLSWNCCYGDRMPKTCGVLVKIQKAA